MKAAVCYDFGKPLVIEDVEIDPPQKGEVKVRVTATGVCHSDIHDIKGELPGPLPFVPGHECAGYVVETGEGVTTVRAGDPVVVTFIPHCGKCFYCTGGFPHLCQTQWPLDTETRLRNREGQPLIAKAKTGAFAEYVVVQESQAVKVPVRNASGPSGAPGLRRHYRFRGRGQPYAGQAHEQRRCNRLRRNRIKRDSGRRLSPVRIPSLPSTSWT